ncbi:coenzyme F420-0:L-glutamate ligase [Candidatus Nitrosotenuis aquarius]|uniref:coenzyme F420-0:L-glutamate ligase n=1 Tax=Candidatus Nitrosotenuis aquarius TaxID=1846278 RepID=UPI002A4E1586|nr:coenzyme F420-0:L-glutamate ligase [Candidatus Nitrosotenuis aquarius]
MLQIIPVPVKSDIKKGDDLAKIFASNFKDMEDGDIIVMAQKIVSKQEGRVVELAQVIPSILSVGLGAEYNKDPKLVEVILSEAKRIVRLESGIIITETRHGFVCANSGVDESNLPPGFASMLPENPDRSASEFAQKISAKSGKKIAVIISDTFGRPFREGQTNVAIGVAGIKPLDDYEGKADTYGRTMRVTKIAQIDELCGAAELVMKKTKNCPFAVIRNFEYDSSDDTIQTLIRSKNTDLFR